MIGHIARDATAIEARETFPLTKQQKAEMAIPKKSRQSRKGKKHGPHKRWKGGKAGRRPANTDTRLHRQRSMQLEQMLAELPRDCSIGVKTSSKGYRQYWRGYKLHLDVADGQIPISAVLTGASVHDSQVAIPLASMSSARVQYCYELMDSAYDAVEILEHSREAGHVPIVDPANRGRQKKKKQGAASAAVRSARELTFCESFRERTMIERVYSRLKDEFGGRYIRVRGASKVMAHLMFGVLALTADQILRLGPGSS